MQKLLFLGVFGWLSGGLAWASEPSQVEEHAIVAIEKAGGEIERDDGSPSKPVVKVTFGCGSSVTDADLAYLKTFPGIQELAIHGHEVTDKGMQQLKSLPNLKSLMLIRVNVTDKGLDHLHGMTSLRKVYFRFTQITETGAKQLAKALPDAAVAWRP